jgi:hypothetical protein
LKIIFFVLIFISMIAVVSFASPVPITNVNSQTKYGTLTYLYYETSSGPASSTPSTNTALIPTSSSGSYSIAQASTAYLWSPQFGSATTISAGNWVLGLWAASASTIVSYVPITITNSQSSATPSQFQEKITWNPSSYTSYEASNLGNIRFYSSSAFTTPLYAWLESCTPSLANTATSATAWIKLTTPIAGNGGTQTIYMAFLSTTTDFDGNYWGDTPNLSGTYGANDNGANVFSFYDNFKGTSLSSKWTSVIGSSGASIAINNGLIVTTTSTGSNAYAFVISATQPYPAVAETYTSSGNSILGVTTTDSTNGFVAPYTGYSMDYYNGYDYLEYQASSGSGSSVHSITQSTFPTGVWQVTWSATASEYFADGAGNTYTGTYSGASIANYGIYVGQSNGVIASSVFRWARMRAYPPNNVMPSVSFGSVSIAVNAIQVSIYVTNSAGSKQSTVASNVQSPTIGSSAAQYEIEFAGSQVSVPQNGYIAISLVAPQTASYTVYWGSGQPTNFQVPYRVLSS